MPKVLRRDAVERLVEQAEHLYSCQGDAIRGLEKINGALRYAPRCVEALVLKGRILFTLDRVAEAMNCYDQAIANDPTSGEAFLERARILYGVHEDYQRAMREARKALRRAKGDRWVSARALRLQGHIFERLSRGQDAIAAYRESLRLNPRDAITHAALGEGLLVAGQPKNALVAFNRALLILRRQTPRDPISVGLVVHGKADALNALGRHWDALMLIKTALPRVRDHSTRMALKALQEQTRHLASKRGLINGTGSTSR